MDQMARLEIFLHFIDRTTSVPLHGAAATVNDPYESRKERAQVILSCVFTLVY